jgi:hypothetical protein
MGRIKSGGVALLAVLALGALAASGAQAGEFGRCVKVERVAKVFKGRYLDKGCTSKATAQEFANGGTANKWEWEPGPTANPKFTSKGKTATVALEGEGGTITCERHTSAGQIDNTKEATLEETFTGCVWSVTSQPCESAGQLPGTIVWPGFDRLVDHGEKSHGGGEPIEGEVWTEFTVFPNAEFTCGPELASFVVFDSVSGVTTGKNLNAMSKKDSTVFGTGKAEQHLETFFGNPKTSKLERLHATLTAEDAVKLEERSELRS